MEGEEDKEERGGVGVGNGGSSETEQGEVEGGGKQGR